MIFLLVNSQVYSWLDFLSKFPPFFSSRVTFSEDKRTFPAFCLPYKLSIKEISFYSSLPNKLFSCLDNNSHFLLAKCNTIGFQMKISLLSNRVCLRGNLYLEDGFKWEFRKWFFFIFWGSEREQSFSIKFLFQNSKERLRGESISKRQSSR